MNRLKLTDKDGRVLYEMDLEENAFTSKRASEGIIEVRGVIPDSRVSPSQVERFASLAFGAKAVPPSGSIYAYAVRTDPNTKNPWAVVHKDPRPMTWHDDEWMAAQGFVPEGGW